MDFTLGKHLLPDPTTYTLVKGNDLQGVAVMPSEIMKRVLVVEDDPVVAMVVEDTLRDMGLDVLIDLTVVDGISDVEAGAFDAALVDLGLRGEDARPIMFALRERGIPFAVMSGGDLSRLAAEFPQVRMLSKPLDMPSLASFVRELLDSGATLPHRA